MFPCHKKKHGYGLAPFRGRYYIPRMMQFCVLGSGSGGNATIVRAGETVLLVDAGFSASRLRDKMRSAGVEPPYGHVRPGKSAGGPLGLF